MASVTLTGNADQLRNAFQYATGTLTQSGRSQTIVVNDTPGTGAVVRVTGADGTVKDF